MTGGPTALDVCVAELLVAQRLLTPEAVAQLRARAAGRPPGPSGSVLLDIAVELNVLPKPVAIRVLNQARAAFAPTAIEPAPATPAEPGQRTRVAPPDPGDRTQWTHADPGDRTQVAPADPGDRTQWTQADAGQRTQWTQADAGQRTQWTQADAGQRTRWTPPGAGTSRPPAASEPTRWELPPESGQGARTSAESQRTRWSADDGGPARGPAPGAQGDATRWEGAGAAPDGAADVTCFDGGAAAAAAAAAAMAASQAAAAGPSAGPEPPEARYDVLEELGPGRLRVLDLRLQRQVILLHATPAEERGLVRHARILAQLDHPAIPRVHDVLRWRGHAAFTTDAVEGDAFGAEGQTQAALLRAFLEVAGAVAHAHERGLVHGSIGRARVVVGTFGRAWLTGWEGARALPQAPDAVVRAAADLDAAPPPGDVPRAPEVQGGHSPGTAADVWGLGRVLERVVTLVGRDAPPELRAIARKACARRPGDRYRTAADLAEDVRRFIDGKAVAALRETPLATLRRLAKHHPAAAGVAGAALLLVFASGLVTLALSRRAYVLSRERGEAARRQNEHAAELLLAARRARDGALARRGLADRRLQLERALLVPEAGTDDPDAARAAQLERAATLLGQLEEDARAAGDQALDTAFAAARVHRAAAEHHLRGAAAPDPARALVELRALIRRLEARASKDEHDPTRPFDERTLAVAQLAQAQLDRFLAARRLPGPEARREEEAALDAMATLDATRELARLERAVRRVEEEARRLARRNPPEAVAPEPDLLAAIDDLARSRPDLAYAHELRGRLRVALSVPGVHRLVGVAAQRQEFNGAFGAFLRASYLDPTEPEPRVSYLEVWNAKFALHYPWRFIGGWALGNALRAARVTPRPEPTLRVATLLGRMERPVAVAPLLERWGPDAALPASVKAAIELARARALLAGGAHVSAEQLARLEVPPELAADHRALRGWALMRAGNPAGLDELMASLNTPPGLTLGLKDVEDALCDPHVDPRLLLPFLEEAIPPPGGGDDNPVVHTLLLARALARARLGLPDRTGDLPRLERVSQTVRVPTRTAARFTLARATSAARRQPAHPGAHLDALLLWARVDIDVGSTEAEAVMARDLIVERLRGLGAAMQAAHFEGFDPVDEVYVRRMWMPPEVVPWRLTEGRR